jgi:hypothetical protein
LKLLGQEKNREHAEAATLGALRQAHGTATSGGSHTGAFPDAGSIKKKSQVSRDGGEKANCLWIGQVLLVTMTLLGWLTILRLAIAQPPT